MAASRRAPLPVVLLLALAALGATACDVATDESTTPPPVSVPAVPGAPPAPGVPAPGAVGGDADDDGADDQGTVAPPPAGTDDDLDDGPDGADDATDDGPDDDG